MLNQNLLLAGDDAYNLTKSLRFRSSASASLNRTPSVTGSQTTWTWSGWVKRSRLGGAGQVIQAAGSGTSNYLWIVFTGSDTLYIQQNPSSTIELNTTAVYRDPSSWYHFVFAIDTTQATSSNRVRLWVNGSQVTSFSTATYPAQNATTYFNTNGNLNRIGNNYDNNANYFDGYLTEVNFIDGQALTPSSFGATSATTGVWQPKKYTGTYGTNGFYLPFTDVATTSGSNAGLGKDFSGNGNYWNTNNISVTSGVTYDSMTDVPTLTDLRTSNYCVMNPLRPSSYGAATLTEGNLKASQTASAYVSSTSTIPMSSGKWYWEVNCGTTGFVTSIGIASTISANGAGASGAWCYHYDGSKYVNGSNSAYGASYTGGDVLGFAFDATAGSLTCYKNNTSQGVLVSGLSAGDYYAFTTLYGSNNVSYNFGQRPFAYTPPTGYVALNTYNLPTPTIGATASTQANKNFDIATYNNATVVSGLGFAPDLVWHKSRNQAYSHYLYDKLRGVGAKGLNSNSTASEGTNDALGIVSFDSSGVTYSSDAGLSQTNAVGWFWKANGTGVTNTAGSITSTVSANTSAGFSVVTYTGNGTSGATVGHGLGVAAKMIIVKNRSSSTGSWIVAHTSLSSGYNLELNGTTGQSNTFSRGMVTAFNSTTFTLTAGSAGTSLFENVNQNTQNFVAYCFAEVAGYSKFGSYTGNGSTNGPFVHLGFRPRYVMIKRTDGGTANWYVLDSARNTYNLANAMLFPNLSAGEVSTSEDNQDFLSNGFKVRTSNQESNISGGTYIYMAFAEVPTKFSLAR